VKPFLARVFLSLSIIVSIGTAQSGTNAAPDANPGRPTVSTPATLTPAGYLQFENGALFAESSTEFSRRFGIGQVTKLTVLPRLELFARGHVPQNGFGSRLLCGTAELQASSAP